MEHLGGPAAVRGVGAAASFERKRALTGVVIFGVVTLLVRAIPAILTGVFAGA